MGPGPRLAAFVALLMIPAAAVLAFAWFAPDRFLPAGEFTAPITRGLAAALGGVLVALVGLGWIAVASTREPAKSELIGSLVAPPLLALVAGKEAIAAAMPPVALCLAIGLLLAYQEGRERASARWASLRHWQRGRVSPK